MPSPTQTLRALNQRRLSERDGRIRAIGRDIDRWSRRVEQQVMGIVAQALGGQQGVIWSIDGELKDAITDVSAILEKGLRSMVAWGELSASENFVRAIPMDVWVRRLLPIKTLVGTEGLVEVDLSQLEIENELQRIADGKVSDAKAREIIRQVEFPPLPADQVDKILTATNAHDGMSAMQRIRTVLPRDISRLKQVIVGGLSQEVAGADAIRSIARMIRPIVGNDPGQSTGMNYRAKRIARTEGVRVAEDSLRESWKPAGDLIEGIRSFSARVARSRDDHVARHRKMYYRTPNGEYIARDGEPLPSYPLGANCLCWTSPELRDDLTAGLPPVKHSKGYRASKARRERERKALAKKSKPTQKKSTSRPERQVPRVPTKTDKLRKELDVLKAERQRAEADLAKERARKVKAEPKARKAPTKIKPKAPTKTFRTFKSGAEAEKSLATSAGQWSEGADYFDNRAVKAYAGTSDSYLINDSLRGTIKGNKRLTEKADALAEVLDKAQFPEDVRSFRAINPKSDKESAAILEGFQSRVGETFTDNAFVSTTANRSYAKKWAKQAAAQPIAVEVHIPKGSKAAYLPKDIVDRQEWEVLVQRNSSFRVQSVKGNRVVLELLQ